MKPTRLARLTPLLLLSLTWLRSAQTAQGSDVSSYDVRKGIQFTQTGTGAPVADTNNGYVFVADVSTFLNNTVNSASVLTPFGTNLTLTPAASQNGFQYQHKYNTLNALDTHDPDGNYAMTINAIHDGIKTLILSLTGAAYPNPPHLTDYPTLQMVNTNGYFQATWDPFVGGTTNDFVQLRIQDAFGNRIFETPDPGKEGVLDGTATSALIYVPGALTAGQIYSKCTLAFYKHVFSDTNSYPGAVGSADYYIRTSFTVVPATNASPDTKLYEVSKGRRFVQTSSAFPTPEAGHKFEFQAAVQATRSNLVTGAKLLLPNSALQVLVSQGDGVNFGLTASAATQIALDALYANGAYGFTINAVNDGNKSLTLPLTGDAYPPPPRIANFDATQSVYANQGFTVVWDPWPGGTAADFIQLRIEDLQNNKLFETADLGKLGALNGKTTSAVVKAGNLRPGRSWLATLLFKRIPALNTTNYPAVLGLADYYGKTKFTLQTAPADVLNYGVFKGQRFIQSGSGAPIAQTSSPFVFESTIEASASNVVSAPAVVTPLGASKPLAAQSGGRAYDFTDGFSVKSALDATYTAGTYAIDLNTSHDGVRIANLPLPADTYPNAPHINNAYTAQLISYDSDFALNWDAFVGGTTNDSVQVEISDLAGNVVYKSVPAGGINALTGLSTSAFIPAFTLAPNQGYKATLLFQKLTTRDASSYPGSLGLAGYFARTQFGIATSGAGNPPSLSSAKVSPSGQFQFLVNGIAGETYRIDGSSNLLQWITLATNTSGIIFIDPNSTNYPHFFYRAVFLP
jgi:hypothetical protein